MGYVEHSLAINEIIADNKIGNYFDKSSFIWFNEFEVINVRGDENCHAYVAPSNDTIIIQLRETLPTYVLRETFPNCTYEIFLSYERECTPFFLSIFYELTEYLFKQDWCQGFLDLNVGNTYHKHELELWRKDRIPIVSRQMWMSWRHWRKSSNQS